MSDQILALVPLYGVPVMALAVMLSCIGIPIPAALVMLIGGSMVATGEMSPGPSYIASLLAATAGDQIGFWVGRLGGRPMIEKFTRDRPKRVAMVQRAHDFTEKRGALAIFLTRWLLAMIGPYVNPVAGASGMRWRIFSIAAFAGEILWVGIYIGLGYTFSHNIVAVAQIAGNASGFIAAGLATLFLGWRITRVLHMSLKNGKRRFLKPRGRR
ncbi:DedA family protein [Martelella sp. HB161492]|uniref:DedA family protein n=1 Tax=Martelella sp. HB161492 TaxID=2720726 RepID=UPI001591EA78|nr:DedA family protein [Martelella sp. HB161492]